MKGEILGCRNVILFYSKRQIYGAQWSGDDGRDGGSLINKIKVILFIGFYNNCMQVSTFKIGTFGYGRSEF